MAFFLNILTACLNLMSPFLVKKIIEFIQNKEIPISEGLLYIFMLIITQAFYYLISEHLDFYSKMVGVKSTNSMIALIYRK